MSIRMFLGLATAAVLASGVALVSGGPAAADHGKIVGKVTDATSGVPLDGGLAHTQVVTMSSGSGIRVHPRDVAALANDAQFAVVVEGTGGTVTAIVIEFASGGDNAMTYEGFPE